MSFTGANSAPRSRTGSDTSSPDTRLPSVGLPAVAINRINYSLTRVDVALRIGFDLDGVFADMEAELLRQAVAVFGEPMKRRLEERSSSGSASVEVDPGETPIDSTPTPQAVAEASADNVPPLLKINMSSRQQRRLWRHVESIENFWLTLEELEVGVIERLARLVHARRRHRVRRTRERDRFLRGLVERHPS